MQKMFNDRMEFKMNKDKNKKHPGETIADDKFTMRSFI